MKNAKVLILLFVSLCLFSGCGGNSQSKYPIKVGLSMDTLRAARWAVDRDVFTAKCNEQGVGVLVQSAESNDALQN